jgi:hypothetical protein
MLYNVMIQSFLGTWPSLVDSVDNKCHVSETGCTSSVSVSKNNLVLMDKVQEKKIARNILFSCYLSVHPLRMCLNDRSIYSTKAISPESSILCFLFQGLVSSVFIKAIQ